MNMKSERGFSTTWVLIIVATIIVLLAGYFLYQSSSDTNDTVSNTVSTQETAATQEQAEDTNEQKEEEEAETGTVITSGDSEFGTILFDGNGQAIYIWEVEETSEAECYVDCAEAWPPVLTDGAPSAAGDVNGELLGTTERTDGTTQVTYNGHPLYYYAHEAPGEVKCHNVSTHGGLWWVIQPNGNRAE